MCRDTERVEDPSRGHPDVTKHAKETSIDKLRKRKTQEDGNATDASENQEMLNIRESVSSGYPETEVLKRNHEFRVSRNKV